MGAESLTKGIRTCALLVLTTVAITDHRYLCPAPSPARRHARTTHCRRKWRAGQQPLGAAAMRQGATLEELPQAAAPGLVTALMTNALGLSAAAALARLLPG
jgi:hypothetical protein